MIYRDIRAVTKFCRMNHDKAGFAVARPLELLQEDFIILHSEWASAPHFDGPPVRSAQLIATVVSHGDDKWIANSVYMQLVRWYAARLSGYNQRKTSVFFDLDKTKWRPADDAMSAWSVANDYLPGVRIEAAKGLPVDVALAPNASKAGEYIVMGIRPRKDAE